MIFEPSRIIDVSVPSRSIETTTERPVESVSSSRAAQRASADFGVRVPVAHQLVRFRVTYATAQGFEPSTTRRLTRFSASIAASRVE